MINVCFVTYFKQVIVIDPSYSMQDKGNCKTKECPSKGRIDIKRKQLITNTDIHLYV